MKAEALRMKTRRYLKEFKAALGRRMRASKLTDVCGKESGQDDVIEPIGVLEPLDLMVSVVIPTLNGDEGLRQLLQGLQGQKGIGRMEIILVDSGSRDQTLAIGREFGVVTIEIPQESFSHSYARNLGAGRAGGTYLLFMTQDVAIVEPYWLYRLFQGIYNYGAVAVTSIERPRADADLYSRLALCHHHFVWELDKGGRVMAMPEEITPFTLRMNAQLSDVNCLIEKAVFDRYLFEGDYGEDLNLGVTLVKAGYRLGLVTDTHVIHSHNRAGYYHLKRSFVEAGALKRIFKEFPVEASDSPIILANILEGYGFVLRLMAGITGYGGKTGPWQFFDHMAVNLAGWQVMTRTLPPRHALEEDAVRGLMETIAREVGDLSGLESTGTVVDAVAGYFMEIVRGHITARKMPLEAGLRGEIARTVYQQACWVVGEELAKVDSDKEFLKDSFAALREGV